MPAIGTPPDIATGAVIMSTKAALKAAKSAIDAKKWDEAIEQSSAVLERDPQNYFAKLFLGRANDGLRKLEDAANAYYDAAKIKPGDPQAWLGLRGLFEKQGPAKVDENTQVGLKLAEIYAGLYVGGLIICGIAEPA